MSTEPLLLRVSDLPERWPTSPSLLWPVEVVVREGVLPGRDIVSRERGLPWSNLCFQPDLYYLQGCRQGPAYRPVLPWKTVFCPQAKKRTCVLTNLGSGFPSASQDSISRHLSSQLGIFEELELDKAWAHHRPSFLGCVFPETQRPPAEEASLELCRWLAAPREGS